MEHDILVKLAKRELDSTYPNKWESDGLINFENKARLASTNISEGELKAAWRDALQVLKEEKPEDYKEYQNSKDRIKFDGAIPFSEVTLVKGDSNGEVFSLDFQVREHLITLELTMAEFSNVHTFMAKLKYQTFEYIEYPDASKKRAADKWEEKYVFPWLKSGKIIKHDRYTVGATIIDAIITYCARPIDAGLATKAFIQTEHVVKEGEHLYIPFTGCEAYVRRATGKTSNREMIISVLERIGAKSVREQREGERRRWWKISEQELYANIGDGKPGERENDKPNSGGQGGSSSGWNSVINDIRETESIGYPETDGVPF